MAHVKFLCFTSLLCLLLPLVSGQAGPTNSTPPQAASAVPVYVWYGRNGPNPPTNYSVAFLDSGAVLSSQNSSTFNQTGQLSIATQDTVSSLTQGQLAYISCDEEDYENSFVNCTQTVQNAQHYLTQAGAVILYSKHSAACTGTGIADLTHVYTMISANSSLALLAALNHTNLVNQTGYIAATQDANNTGSSQGLYTPSASTTIAMVVLYSITGIITFLFLMVIILGAYRAHRHPERYGPRNILGMPRQSRARGMARALLDTIPIIKFGENEPTKPTGEGNTNDVELADRTDGAAGPKEAEAAAAEGNTVREANKKTPVSSSPSGDQKIDAGTTTGDSKEDVSKEKQLQETTATEMPPAVPGASTVQIEAATPNAPEASQEGIESCPICTEDFVRGEPARLLPCHHHYHPACIDPWLLNVSSTCPMCRVDLNPPTQDTENQEATTAAATPTAQQASQWPYSSGGGTSNATRRVVMSGFGFLNLAHIGQADPQERIEALRQIRAARQGSRPNNNSGSEGDSTRRSRISRIFHRQSGADQQRSEETNGSDTGRNRE